MAESLIDLMLTEWVKHRAEGRRKGISSRHEWETAPEWAHDEALSWQRQEDAWRLLIGARLAEDAVRAREKGENDG